MQPTTQQLAEMLRCARRELAFRRQVYPGLVRKGRMAQAEAERETAAQELIVSFLDAQQPDRLPGMEG